MATSSRSRAKTAHALTISGFGVGGYTYDGKTNDNSFAAGKVAVVLFRELTDNLYVFGQLTTAISDEGDGEPDTETEIDNLLVSFTPKGASNLSLTLRHARRAGRLRARRRGAAPHPVHLVQLRARPAGQADRSLRGWTLSRKLDLTALIANGWDTPLDPNHGKTVGARLGVLPAERASLGLSALYGSEGPADTTNHRLLLNADYAFEPGRGWIVAGEANYGKDYDLPGGGDARWSGAMLLVHRQVTRNWGIAARAEVLDDKDGARTGLAQTLTSYTIAPIYSIGVGREGIFANIQHTTHRIPRFQLRGEIRVNHSNQDVLRDLRPAEPLGRAVRRAARHDLLARTRHGPLQSASRESVGQARRAALSARAGLRLPLRLPDGEDLVGAHPRAGCGDLRADAGHGRDAHGDQSHATTQPLDLGQVPEMKHTVDTNTLIQDSHIHIMIYAIISALLTLIILGLDWPAWWRDTVIVASFGFGALDFAGQWLIKFGLGGFAWLTIASGWGMSLVYLIVLYSTIRAYAVRQFRQEHTMTRPPSRWPPRSARRPIPRRRSCW